MKLFSLDISIVATAYIRAETPEEAAELARQHLVDSEMQLSSRYAPMGENICIDGSSFEQTIENEEAIAFSPAMTIVGPHANKFDVEEVGN